MCTKELNDVFEIGLHFHEEWIIPLFNYVGCLIYSTKLHESLHLVCVNVFYARKWTTRVGKSEYGKIIIITKYFESTFVVVNTSILNLSLFLLPPLHVFIFFVPFYLTLRCIIFCILHFVFIDFNIAWEAYFLGYCQAALASIILPKRMLYLGWSLTKHMILSKPK